MTTTTSAATLQIGTIGTSSSTTTTSKRLLFLSVWTAEDCEVGVRNSYPRFRLFHNISRRVQTRSDSFRRVCARARVKRDPEEVKGRLLHLLLNYKKCSDFCLISLKYTKVCQRLTKCSQCIER